MHALVLKQAYTVERGRRGGDGGVLAFLVSLTVNFRS
jgi:hypothetical protein